MWGFGDLPEFAPGDFASVGTSVTTPNWQGIAKVEKLFNHIHGSLINEYLVACLSIWPTKWSALNLPITLLHLTCTQWSQQEQRRELIYSPWPQTAQGNFAKANIWDHQPRLCHNHIQIFHLFSFLFMKFLMKNDITMIDKQTLFYFRTSSYRCLLFLNFRNHSWSLQKKIGTVPEDKQNVPKIWNEFKKAKSLLEDMLKELDMKQPILDLLLLWIILYNNENLSLM